MFKIQKNESFPTREEAVLAFWEEMEIFKKSVEQRRHALYFSFYDGPPFATGLPHYGHLLAGTLKDVVPRYKTMKGYCVERRFGWDCHGLPIENEIEKARELSGASSIESFGIAAFNEECRSIVLRYTKEWETVVKRMGRWVDFSRTWKTMDLPFMESVWWVFSQLYGKGLVYEGFKVMPFSAKLGTPLSNFEANLNYKEVDDPSLTVIFPLVSDPKTALLAWTTTPWTLPSNLAVIAGTQLDYIKVKDKNTDQNYILAEARLGNYFKDPKEYEILGRIKGSDLAGLEYVPLFPHFAKRRQENAFRVLNDDFVSTEDGTGLVHAAPAFGEVDFFVCSKAGIEIVCPVDQNGRFTKEMPEYENLFVKDADKEIIRRLKQEKRVFHHATIRHRYPFCWRSDTPLIYKAVRTWFVAVEKIKDKMIACNEKIHWIPEHIKHGRFGKWLENARDWAISRNRYWGTPIPLWRSQDGEIRVFGSVKELEEKVGRKIDDLHRHFIDDLVFEENGKEFRRVPEVFDCWFESGSMPYAQSHFPFENREQMLQTFPADFIAEGLDQTRGWFYTLIVLSTALFNEPAFKNVIVNGIILAEDGNKMSKRLKNYPDSSKILNDYGADALRLYLLNSPAVSADDLRFSERGVELILRQALIPLWNSYVFLGTYADIYKWKPHEKGFSEPTQGIDKWILSLLQKLILDVTTEMDQYQLGKAVEPFVGFIDQLTNWYIRRCRDRFWSDIPSRDRDEAFETLYTVLWNLSKIAAPFIPFLSDAIYRELRESYDPESVHLCDYPVYHEHLRNETLEQEMSGVQKVVSAGHSLRKEQKIKVRQPLAKAFVICPDLPTLESLRRQSRLIAEELNVKHIEFYIDEEDFVTLNAKPNFRVLGKKVGPLMNEVHKAISALNQKELYQLMSGQSLTLILKGQEILLTPEDVGVERQVRQGLIAQTVGNITVALDIALNEELLLEGLARELVNKINTMRRDQGYAVVDRIVVSIETTPRIEESFKLHREYITHEVLATEVRFGACEGEEVDLNGELAKIILAKV